VVIVLDSGLLELLDPTEGMQRRRGHHPEHQEEGIRRRERGGRNIKVATVDANKIAQEELGRVIVNTTMLGAFVKATGMLGMDDIKEPLLERFGKKLGEKNLKALERAFHEVTIV
jgi:2-oxoacid:acceptor oxidoreductase gamma subunit (pyruvate/2-ketoisovalerate family)